MPSPKPLKGSRIFSLALNLPGPAALMRLQSMGAACSKLQSPAGDPMGHYNPQAFAQLHAGIKIVTADLKTPAGQRRLHTALARTDVLLTSFRPSALAKLGLAWKALHAQYPALSMVCIVGSPGARAEEPGHDLTYLAENGLVAGLEMPATLYADMAGSLCATEAVLQAVLLQKTQGKASCTEVALSSAAAYLALPRSWGLTDARPAAVASNPSAGLVGGRHAGYRVYSCKDGRVAVAALEPHFAAALCAAANIPITGAATLLKPSSHSALEHFFAQRTRAQLNTLATAQDIPLYCMH